MANANPLEGVQEIQQLLVSYAKQETVEPLKTLGRYIGFGVAGALLVSLGTFFIGLGILRLTQSIDALAGSSWASTLPYLITLAVLVAFMASIFLAMGRAKRKVA